MVREFLIDVNGETTTVTANFGVSEATNANPAFNKFMKQVVKLNKAFAEMVNEPDAEFITDIAYADYTYGEYLEAMDDLEEEIDDLFDTCDCCNCCDCCAEEDTLVDEDEGEESEEDDLDLTDAFFVLSDKLDVIDKNVKSLLNEKQKAKSTKKTLLED